VTEDTVVIQRILYIPDPAHLAKHFYIAFYSINHSRGLENGGSI